MKKQVRSIIALGAVLAALGGGFAVLKLTEPKEGGDTSSVIEVTSVPDGAGTLLVSDNGSEGTVKEAVVINTTDRLEIEMKDAPSEDSAATYTLKEYKDLDVNTSVVGTLVNNGNGLTAEALIAKDCTDTAKYGLAEPEATVEFTYESGNTVRFFVGDTAPSGTVYVLVDGTKDVYTVSSSKVANYSKGVKEFIRKTILEEPEDYPLVESLRIERDDIDYDLLFEYDIESEDSNSGGTSSAHKLVEPVESYLTIERSSDVITGMFGLSGDDIYALHCKEADIAGAGLASPFCTVTMKCDNDETYTLLLSELFTDESGKRCCYAMMEGGKVIYTLSEANARWLSVTPIDVASRLMITSYVWSITELSASGGGESAQFSISLRDPSASEGGNSADNYIVMKDGKEFDSERYRKFYSFLISSNAEEFALDVPVPEGEPAATISYKDSYNGKTFTYDFYDDSLMRSLIVVDGKSKYYCTKSFVDTLIKNIGLIDTDEDYITTW